MNKPTDPRPPLRVQIHEKFTRCPACEGHADKKASCPACGGAGLLLEQVDRNYAAEEAKP